MTDLGAALERILELHRPTDETVDVDWSEDDGPSIGCAATCVSDRTCPGHTVTIKACAVCLGAGDDGIALYRVWPCATATIAHEALGIDVLEPPSMLSRYTQVTLPFDVGTGTITLSSCKGCHALVADEHRDDHWDSQHAAGVGECNGCGHRHYGGACPICGCGRLVLVDDRRS